MTQPGTEAKPLRVAIVGAGPAGYYAADHLLKQDGVVVEVDMIDRLPTPYGLVRAGVAPDHQKIKSVTAAFDKVAAHPRFRFYGGVEFGKHITVGRPARATTIRSSTRPAPRRTGAWGSPARTSRVATPPRSSSPGTTATPTTATAQFDLSQERAAVVGVGNVAIDVARMLCRSPEELATTDIADHALEALRKSRIKEVYLLGRRGPAQAAFTNPEIKEVGELADADVTALPGGGRAGPAEPRRRRAEPGPRHPEEGRDAEASTRRRKPTGKSEEARHPIPGVARRAPRQRRGPGGGDAAGAKPARGRRRRARSRPRPPDQFETLPVGLVFRSVGYRGSRCPGVPFHESWGVICNENGRVLDPDTKQPVVGEYAAGWIKRGPTGVIGTNKPDAAQTVVCMMEDLAQGATSSPRSPTPPPPSADPSPSAALLLLRGLAQAQRDRSRPGPRRRPPARQVHPRGGHARRPRPLTARRRLPCAQPSSSSVSLKLGTKVSRK